MVLPTMLAACAAPAADRIDAVVQSRPVVLLGEVHDNAGVHAARARALQALLASGARPALLMEMFDRERQPALDAALAAADAQADGVIAAAGGPGWSWPLYRPYIALALRYRLPIIAANVSRADARRVIEQGLAAEGFEPTIPQAVVDGQTDAIVAGHCGQIDRQQAGRLALAQVARDQFMARQVERFAGRGLVLLAGNGHVRRDIGVPQWLTPATRARTVAVGMLEAGQDDPLAFDAASEPFGPQPGRDDPCAAFR